MDIPREQHKGRRLIRRILLGLLLVGSISAITVYLARLEPAAPSVEREMLLMDTVQRGNMILQVRGVGKLMSEDMLIVPATVAGRVKCILVEAGTPVEPNTVILELTNPALAYGGGPVLGVRGVAIVGHGRARATEIARALHTAREAVAKDFVAIAERELEALRASQGNNSE